MPSLKTFEPYRAVVDIHAFRFVHWREAIRLGEVMESNGLPVVLRDGMPAIRIRPRQDYGTEHIVSLEVAVERGADVKARLLAMAPHLPPEFFLSIPGAPLRPPPTVTASCPDLDSPPLA